MGNEHEEKGSRSEEIKTPRVVVKTQSDPITGELLGVTSTLRDLHRLGEWELFPIFDNAVVSEFPPLFFLIEGKNELNEITLDELRDTNALLKRVRRAQALIISRSIDPQDLGNSDY